MLATDFLKMGIRQEINDILKKKGIIEPTPVQVQAIPLIMTGRDVIAQAQTGTGKTLAFLLPLLEKLDPVKPYIQGLIITPTRELALQIKKETEKFVEDLQINVLSAYGGQDLMKQTKKLKGIVHLVVATPGRLLDHVRRENVDLSRVSFVVLDEADISLQMGFLEDVEAIIRKTAYKRQMLLFSATIPQQIRHLARNYMRNPVDIKIQSKQVTLDEIQQFVIEVPELKKMDILCPLIDRYNPYLAMVFCRTKKDVIKVNDELLRRGYNSDQLHGDLSQAKREQVMRRFREAKLQILVATDVASRGLDVEGITHVFNYEIPHDVESYIHRIGRTGRAGDTGVAITFVCPFETKYLQLIEKGIGVSIEKRNAAGEKIVKVARKKSIRPKKTWEKKPPYFAKKKKFK